MIPYLIRTPLGIAVAAVHWIAVAFALLGDRVEVVYPLQVDRQLTLLQYYLLILNFPALLLTNLIVQGAIYVSGLAVGVVYFYFGVGIIAITLQWLLLGGFLQMFLDEIRPESRSLQLKAEQAAKTGQST